MRRVAVTMTVVPGAERAECWKRSGDSLLMTGPSRALEG